MPDVNDGLMFLVDVQFNLGDEGEQPKDDETQDNQRDVEEGRTNVEGACGRHTFSFACEC